MKDLVNGRIHYGMRYGKTADDDEDSNYQPLDDGGNADMTNDHKGVVTVKSELNHRGTVFDPLQLVDKLKNCFY